MDYKCHNSGEYHSRIDKILHQEPLEPLRSFYPEILLSQEQDFSSHEDFDEIVKSVCKHKNRAVNEDQAKLIWELHLDGFSSRQIAIKVDTDHVTAWRIVSILTKWARYE